MAAMSIQEVRHRVPHRDVITRLAERRALVVLDDCEHVLAAASALAEALVASCGRLAVLATSRQPLGVAGEVVWRVPCLSVPAEQGAVDVEVLDASEAVSLFGRHRRGDSTSPSPTTTPRRWRPSAPAWTGSRSPSSWPAAGAAS